MAPITIIYAGFILFPYLTFLTSSSKITQYVE